MKKLLDDTGRLQGCLKGAINGLSVALLCYLSGVNRMKVLVTALFVISWVASALYLRISAEVSEPSFYVLYGLTGMALYLILEEIGVAK